MQQAIETNHRTALADSSPPPRPNNMLAAITPNNIGELIQLATIYYDAGICPKNCNKPAAVAAVIAAGMEAGLRPGQALSSMYLVNGRAVMFGDAPLALVRASGLLADIKESESGTGDAKSATCTLTRKNPNGSTDSVTRTFSCAEARRAGLFMKNGKPGPWDTYPDRMLQLRPRGWCVRDLFGDVLMGLGIAEEVEDYGAAASPAKAAPVQATVTSVSNDTPPATTAAPAIANGITEGQRFKLRQNLPDWFKGFGLDWEENRTACLTALTQHLRTAYGVDEIKSLTEEQGEHFLTTVLTTAQAVEDAANPPLAGLFGATTEQAPPDTSAVNG